MYTSGKAFLPNHMKCPQVGEKGTALFSNNLYFPRWNFTIHAYIPKTLTETLWQRQDRAILAPLLRWSTWDSERGSNQSSVTYPRSGRSGAVRTQTVPLVVSTHFTVSEGVSLVHSLFWISTRLTKDEKPRPLAGVTRNKGRSFLCPLL